MDIIFYPDDLSVKNALSDDEPLLVLISFDGKKMIVSHIDNAVEHHILLKKVNLPDTDIDKYFRIVADSDGADWTFVCPPDYKNIENRHHRIQTFYKDGISVISEGLKELGINTEINIPKRYRRHYDILWEN